MVGDASLKKLLDEIDWETFAPKLLAVAIRYGRWYTWNSGGIDLLGEGNTPKDIAQRVIEKAYSGKRTKPRDMDVKIWLIRQIRSEVNNLYEKYSHQKEFAVFDPYEEGNEEDIQDEFDLASVDDGIFPHAKFLTPEQELLKKESYDAYANAVVDAVDGDPELEELYAALKNVGDKPQELAKALNKPVDKVYTLLRRLRRRVESPNQDD